MVDTLYHDGKNVIGTIYSDTKSGISSAYPDIKSAVVAIGKAIGVASEHVYGILVKKYIVIGVKQCLKFFLGLIALITGLIMWRQTTKNSSVITYKVIVPFMLVVWGIVIMVTVNYDEMLMGLINPEYGAIDYILNYSKSLFGK